MSLPAYLRQGLYSRETFCKWTLWQFGLRYKDEMTWTKMKSVKTRFLP